VAAGVEHQAGHGHRGQPAVQRRAVARVVQVRDAVVPGQLRLAVLGLEQRGQLVEEAVVVRLSEGRRELDAESGQGWLEAGGLVRTVAMGARAERLRAAAPDRGRGAAATFYAGLIADNLRGDGAAARTAFAAALSAAEEAGDDLTVSEALRHLGYHHGEAGDTEQARQMWERSAELRERAGAVPFALSQHLLLAGLARDTGNPDQARALAGQVRRWARALGVGVLEAGAAELC